MDGRYHVDVGSDEYYAGVVPLYVLSSLLSYMRLTMSITDQQARDSPSRNPRNPLDQVLKFLSHSGWQGTATGLSLEVGVLIKEEEIVGRMIVGGVGE